MHAPHILAIQEVRSPVTDVKRNQLSELRSELWPLYRYSTLQLAAHRGTTTTGNGAGARAAYNEGVGILSQYKILNSSVISLTPTAGDVDINPRFVLIATIELPSEIRVGTASAASTGTNNILTVLSTHLSYSRMGQCRNCAEIKRIAQSITTPMYCHLQWQQ
jgi:endonuclease/exonuclease/phosphatase family metal-dependent hydrolase